jgi:hypothetical protein
VNQHRHQAYLRHSHSLEVLVLVAETMVEVVELPITGILVARQHVLTTRLTNSDDC